MALRGSNPPFLRLAPRIAAASATVALAAGLAGCGGSGDDPTAADVLADGGSAAQVTIDGVTYEFVVDCYDAGAGSVIVVGEGDEPDAAVAVDEAQHGGQSERSETHILVQAFLGDSYVGVTIEPDEEGGQEVLYEASLDDPLDLVLENDVISADAIAFVRNLDLATGAGSTAGDGTLRVTCGRYEAGSPPGQGA